MANESKYSYCRENREPLTGYHIRKLGPSGKKFDQPADTLALCGRRVEYDLNMDITESTLKMENDGYRLCGACKEEYTASLLFAHRRRPA
jgi:hypothetical protein